MKLHHLRTWTLIKPVFIATTLQQIIGTMYVNAHFVAILCQPLIFVRHVDNHAYEPVEQFNLKFSHYVATQQDYQKLLFSMKLIGEKIVFSPSSITSALLFTTLLNSSAHRLEMSYD